MVRAWSWTVLVFTIFVGTVNGQTAPWQFQWQAGQLLTYRVEQETRATETVDGKKSETVAKMKNVKQWRVLEVDPAGTAVLQLSIRSLRLETTTPSGEVLIFDSAEPDKSNPQMREQMAKYVGSTLAVLRVERTGKVVEVKESKFGSASRYESEPPFALTLPEGMVRPGSSWERHYAVTLDPPAGTGEKHGAMQSYTWQSSQGTTAVITLKTSLKAPPQASADQVPLLQALPEGEICFDTRTGRLSRATLRIDKELKGHEGEGSSYRFQSRYTEESE